MIKDQRKPQKALWWRRGGPAAGPLCPVLGHWEDDGKDEMLWVDMQYPQWKASPCAVWQTLRPAGCFYTFPPVISYCHEGQK